MLEKFEECALPLPATLPAADLRSSGRRAPPDYPARVVGNRLGARPEVPADICAVGGMGESEGPSLDRPFAGFR